MARFLILLILAIWSVPLAAMGPWQKDCGGEIPCEIGARSYHLKVPDGWDGVTPMPVMLHFHGWQRQGSLVVQHTRISGATRRRGVLLLAPNGTGRTWDFWRPETDDVPFAAAVIEDAATRFPIDRSRIYISGYSYGSAMAWRYVCQNGQNVAALLAVAGTLRQDEDCPQAPAEVRHVHGLADTVMNFPMGPGGDRHHPVALWRNHLGCHVGTDKGPWQARSFLTFERTFWTCDTGTVSLDLHPGGHFIPHGWIARQLDDLLGLPPSYP
jgi:polyhydroxybutyrate depolymerase